MSSDPRKRAAGDALATSGPVGKKSVPAQNAGQSPKEEPLDDPQEGQSENSGMPSTALVNDGGPTNARNNEDGSAEDRKIAEYTKQIETLQSDLTKLRHDQKKKDKATAAKEEELNKKLTAQIGVKEHLEKKVEELTKKIDELERRPAAGEGDQENVHQPQAEQAAQEMKRLRQELREAKKKAEDAEKKRSEAAQDAERYERQAEEAEQRVREQEEEVVYRGGEMARLQTEVDQLKVKLQQATEGRERRQAALEAAARNVVQQQWDADREKLLKQIEKLKREVAAYKQQNRIMNEEEAPDDILTAKLDCTMELYEIVKMLKGMTRHLPLKFDQNGLSIMTVQPRPTVPVVILKLNADFFDAYECRKGFARRVEYKRLLKALKFSREDECEMSHQQGSSEICFEFENNDTGESNTVYAKEVRGARAPLAPTKVEYAVEFTMNSYKLDTLAKKLSPIYIKAKQDKVVLSTDESCGSEPSESTYVAKVGEEPRGDFSFKVEDYDFSAPVKLCVDAKYLKMCVRPCRNLQQLDAKFVRISLSKDRMQLDYKLKNGSVTYYLPNVAPNARGERCFSPEKVEYVDED